MPLIVHDDAQTTQSQQQESQTPAKPKKRDSKKTTLSAQDKAKQQAQAVLDTMSRQERIGQLIMAPQFAGSDASTLQPWFTKYHIGSVLLLGNWNGGVEQVAAQAKKLQSYAHPQAQLLISADQEGGAVQHLRGTGFDRMPTAVEQGALSTTDLRSKAQQWGSQLASAGVNLNLAPVAGTVSTSSREANAPIGMYDRDFGLDATGNGAHAGAFIQGMHDAHVLTAVKHFPGLGAITGNTDFTAHGIMDTTTTFDGQGQVLGFTTAMQAQPDMVMMALATYTQLDSEHPAALSPEILDNYLRNTLHYDGVVTSDSMSAQALAGIPAKQLGVQFVQAGGDLVCIGDSKYVAPIVQGMVEADAQDPNFAQRVDQSALRVLTLKAQAGLLS